MELLLGAGAKHDKRIHTRGTDQWEKLVTLDNNQDHNPDILFDLSTIGSEIKSIPTKIGKGDLPFLDNHFDEIHAYEVLEHIGQQGDYKKLFAQFSEFWRILKPNGLFCATCPSYKSMWAWGDPSHTRVITNGTLVFLNQMEYKRQVGKTALSDFRHIYFADFEPVQVKDDGESFSFVLRAIKPSRHE